MRRMGEIAISTVRGLTEVEAASRLITEGFNEMPSARQRGLLQIACGIAREPMFLRVVACGAIYLVLREV
jgi:Ca2+-transporting ATPase